MIHYLSRAEFAARIGVRPDTLGRYKLPEPDATIGDVRGWLPDTVDSWHSKRQPRAPKWLRAEASRIESARTEGEK